MTFSREVKKGSMRQVVAGIYTLLRTDDELMRLLVYCPDELDGANIVEKDVDGNVIESEEYWERVNTSIHVTEKSSNIELDAMCRLYIYPGRRRPVQNYLLAKQEIIVDVFVHDSFSGDMRLEWINDRINELLALEHIEGALGKLEYAQGDSRVAPIGYAKYQHTFVFGTGKK